MDDNFFLFEQKSEFMMDVVCFDEILYKQKMQKKPCDAIEIFNSKFSTLQNENYAA